MEILLLLVLILLSLYTAFLKNKGFVLIQFLSQNGEGEFQGLPRAQLDFVMLRSTWHILSSES